MSDHEHRKAEGDAVTEIVAELGVRAAQIEFSGGTFDLPEYMIPRDSPDGEKAFEYGPPQTATGPVHLVRASGTVATRFGEPFLHCHAAYVDADGTFTAGHIFPTSVTGRVGIRAVIWPLPGVETVSTDDPEVGMPVSTPTRTDQPIPDTGMRVVVARILPGCDIPSAATQLAAKAGFRRGIVRLGLGSIVGPTFVRGTSHDTIAGVCAEIITLTGEVGPDATDARMHVLIGDVNGVVHGGIIDGPNSPVAATTEILVIEA